MGTRGRGRCLSSSRAEKKRVERPPRARGASPLAPGALLHMSRPRRSFALADAVVHLRGRDWPPAVPAVAERPSKAAAATQRATQRGPPSAGAWPRQAPPSPHLPPPPDAAAGHAERERGGRAALRAAQKRRVSPPGKVVPELGGCGRVYEAPS